MRDLSFDLVKLHYRRAERAIKRCARLSYAVPTPAINQLRYAGYHVLSAVKAEQVGDSSADGRWGSFATCRLPVGRVRRVGRVGHCEC